MKDIKHQPKNSRGSSPPFQESERWIDDGANGSHWVKMVPISLRQKINGIERPPNRTAQEAANVLSKINDQ